VRQYSHFLFLRLAAILFAAGCAAGAPRIFFTDLDSGPNTGGQNRNGVIVSVYGARFGAMRGTSYVTIGGGRAGAYLAWSDSSIAFQLGPAAVTGDIVVTTAAGQSNSVPFVVRSGRIFFVGLNGSDTNDGSYSKPWRSLLKARDSINAGDTVYAMDGVSQTTDDGQGWRAAMLVRRGGTTGAPMALVAYPGARVTIGSTSGPEFGIRTTQPSYWTIAGLTLRGVNASLSLAGPSSNWRIVANDLSCPDGDGQMGCFSTSQASNLAVYGNNVHNTGRANASAHYHGIYFSTDGNHLDVGWNTVANVRGCRGIQVYSTPLGPGGAGDPTGRNMYDLRFHDNLIHDTQCDGIILATIDPSLGKVEVYNNVIYNAGTGPANPENTGAWTCINTPGTTANGAPGGGMVEVYNNTLYNCGSFNRPPYVDANAGIENGGNNSKLKIRARNNILYQTTPTPYLVSFGPADGVQGANNLFFGAGPAPANPNLTRSLSADPLLANTSQADFHLRPTSPARGVGVTTEAAFDRSGMPRGGTAGYDLGAFEYTRPDVSALSCSPVAIRTPGGAVCRIEFTSGVLDADLDIVLTTDSPYVAPPGRITVSSGSSAADFRLEMESVTANAVARVSAVLDDVTLGLDLYLFAPDDPSPGLSAVVNAASLAAGPLAPGEIVSAFGWNLGTTLSDITALFNDVPAPLLAVRPNQLNAIVPFGTAGMSEVRIQIDVRGVRSNPLLFPVVNSNPGVFTVDSTGRGQAVALNQDQSLNSAANPAARQSIVVLFTAGLGELDPPAADRAVVTEPVSIAVAPVSASIGGVSANVLYATAVPGFVAGMYKVAVQIPDLPLPGVAVPVVLRTGAMDSPVGVTIAVE
jgi:uncharacterized protein (TIGR03437 family)